jgi:hypothetical protein
MAEQTKHVLVGIEPHPLNGRMVALCSCGARMGIRPTEELAAEAHRMHVVAVERIRKAKERNAAALASEDA